MNNATSDRPKLTKPCVKPLRLREAGHPPYSPDLPPSDFYLFGTLKAQIVGSEFESTDELLGTIRMLTNAISQEELGSTLQESERRLEKWIRIDGDYVS
jgi:hypothetical protein